MICGTVDQAMGEFKWVVEDFCRNSKNSEEDLKSPIFSTRGSNKLKWQLSLCLSVNYIHIYLESKNAYNQINMKILAKISILNCKHEKVVTSQHCETFTDSTNICWNFLDIVEESFITDKRNQVLTNNALLILCEITLDPNFVDAKNNNLKQGHNLRRLDDDLEKLFENGKFTDVIFTVEDKEISLHKSILASRSPVFEAMFQSNMQENERSKVEVKDIKYPVLKELFRFIYAEKVNGIKELASDLLIAADKYSVEGLKSKCEETLCDELTTDNVLEYLGLADVYSATKLKSEAIDFIASHSNEIIDNPNFKLYAELNPDIICEVFRAVVRKNNNL